MTDNNNQKNKQETLNEETKKKELSMEDLEQVTGGGHLTFGAGAHLTLADARLKMLEK